MRGPAKLREDFVADADVSWRNYFPSFSVRLARYPGPQQFPLAFYCVFCSDINLCSNSPAHSAKLRKAAALIRAGTAVSAISPHVCVPSLWRTHSKPPPATHPLAKWFPFALHPHSLTAVNAVAPLQVQTNISLTWLSLYGLNICTLGEIYKK